ncbi:DNA mismatch repair protein Msh4 [Myxozyma melibiosi]|uniref:DNA mismatch repair protein Msh4 n=1 Tax=Myxozyma melibiosi TaxID=54550 RepID=A0ABR1F494_9ASCO
MDSPSAPQYPVYPRYSRAPSRAPSRAGTASARPYSAMSNATSTAATRVICAITQGRGVAATVGMCFFSIDTGECILSEIVDTQTYVRTVNKLAVCMPVEVLVPSTTLEAPAGGMLVKVIQENFPNLKVTGVSRNFYNEAEGKRYIQELSFKDDLDSISMLVMSKFYAVCAAAAVIKYIDTSLNLRFALHSLRVRYESSEGSMLIDYDTVRALELTQNLVDPKSKYSLLGVLDNTSTPMGGRLLRSQILQPLTDKQTIERRYSAVEELTANEELFFGCKSALKSFQDLDRLLTSLISIPTKPSIKFSEQRINSIILLKQSVNLISEAYEATASARSNLLISVRELCRHPSLSAVKALIDASINEDCVWAKTPVESRNQRCYAVKKGKNGFLDVARQTYKEATEDVMEVIAQLKEEYDLQQLEVKYEIARGYYVRVPIDTLRGEDGEGPVSLPEVFINRMTKRDHIECSTLELLKLNGKLRDALAEIILMSEQTVEQLIEEVRSHIPALYKACEGIAMLDAMVSFAHVAVSSEKGYVRPILMERTKQLPRLFENPENKEDEDEAVLAIKNSRHPIKEIVLAKKGSQFVENDVYASPATSRFQIITGTNMSGKSTYIRQVALLCIMAQVGSFVPADHAQFPILEGIFARISAGEDAEITATQSLVSTGGEEGGGSVTGTSTFATDMAGAAFILANAKPRTLVLIDEMGRGSSVRDGLAITTAIAESLVDTGATVLFATHFLEIARVLSGRGGVAELHMRVDVEDSAAAAGNEENTGSTKLRMRYKISNGVVSPTMHYGLRLTRVLPFPKDMLDRAEEISNYLDARETKSRAKTGLKTQIVQRRRTILDLLTSLKGVWQYCEETLGKAGEATEVEERNADVVLGRWLDELQQKFVVKMMEAGEE